MLSLTRIAIFLYNDPFLYTSGQAVKIAYVYPQAYGKISAIGCMYILHPYIRMYVWMDVWDMYEVLLSVAKAFSDRMDGWLK